MSLSFVTLDAFTTSPYYGNPLGVIHVPASQSLSQEQKQLIAREFNLSECVFLHEQSEAEKQNGDVRIDIFTPFAEVPFAGHPTVGVSNYLLRYNQGSSSFKNVVALQAKAGRIPIELSEDGKGISLKVAHNVRIHDNPFQDRSFSKYPVVSIVKGMTFILAQLQDLDELAKPTENLLGSQNSYKSYNALDEGWRTGLTASYFFVDLGKDQDGVRLLRTRTLSVREDPATGSAASALCSFLTLTEKGETTRKYHITQGVEMGRKSDIYIQVSVNDDGKTIKEVVLSGTAVLVMEGKLNVPPVDG